MKLLTSGDWWLESKSDPRWNCFGRTEECGAFVMPPECEAAIARLEKEIGDKPIDLTFGYMKD